MKQHLIPLADRDEFSRFVIDTIVINRTRVSMLSPRTIYEVESLIGCLMYLARDKARRPFPAVLSMAG
jgi:hypothetical protein